ncbi:MAG: ABC transporter substrate-binding protein [Defluviitaleaceae bacterium]|nr:ABC transporter substrate-binding protein [Defluviitaleaceae bacterium]
MNRIRIGFIAALLVMALAFLAACGGNDNDTPPQDDPPATTTDAPAPPPTENNQQNANNNEETPPVSGTEFAPREFVWVTWMPDHQTHDPDPTIADPDYLDQRWINLQRIYEEFGWSIRYEIISYEEIFPAFVASVMAGTPLGDIVELPTTALLVAAQMGLLQAVEDFAPPGADIWQDDMWVRPGTFFGGNHYAVASRRLNTENTVFAYRQDLIQAAGLELPSVLYERGEWTWDVFLDYLRATTIIGPDGNVVQYGLRGTPRHLMPLIVASNDGHFITPELTSGFHLPETVRAFEFLHQIYQTEGLGHPPVNDWYDHIGEGEIDAAFFVAEMWALGDWTPRGQHIGVRGGVPFPIGPNNTSGNLSMSRILAGPAIPRGVENPYEVYRMLTEMRHSFRYFSEEAYESPIGEATNAQYQNATREGWVHTMFASGEDADRVLAAMNGLDTFDVGTNIGEIQDIITSIGIQIMEGNGMPAQLLEAYRQQLEDIIDTFFGN